jgi:N6-adenosine-specific RNA methylase IME4
MTLSLLDFLTVLGNPIRNRPESVFQVPRQGHSEKPDVVYDMIAKMYANRKYLELFARKEQVG